MTDTTSNIMNLQLRDCRVPGEARAGSETAMRLIATMPGESTSRLAGMIDVYRLYALSTITEKIVSTLRKRRKAKSFCASGGECRT